MIDELIKEITEFKVKRVPFYKGRQFQPAMIRVKRHKLGTFLPENFTLSLYRDRTIKYKRQPFYLLLIRCQDDQFAILERHRYGAIAKLGGPSLGVDAHFTHKQARDLIGTGWGNLSNHDLTLRMYPFLGLGAPKPTILDREVNYRCYAPPA